MTSMYALRLLSVVVLVVVMIGPGVALAVGIPTIVPCSGATDGTIGGKSVKACGLCDIAVTAQNILNAGIYIAIFLSSLFFAYAGWIHITALGNEGKVEEAHDIFTTVGLGLVLILAAWLIIDTIMKVMVNGGASYGPWNKICQIFFQHFA